MGHNDDGKLGGICGYAKLKFEERIEAKWKRRSHSEPPGAGRQRGQGKLHKPPQIRTVSEKPRNRLRKPITPQTQPRPQPQNQRPTTDLFVLEYEPNPGGVETGKVLGVYSTFDTVTSGALKHGAYTFSREGLLDGNEYLSPTGRIKFIKTVVQQSGVRAPVPERSVSSDFGSGPLRLDIPHPDSNINVFEPPNQEMEKSAAKETVCLAIREGPQAESWIGIFGDKSLAWGACLKDRALCSLSGTLCEEIRTIGVNNMPQISARLIGSGRYTWLVKEYTIDEPHHATTASWRDI